MISGSNSDIFKVKIWNWFNGHCLNNFELNNDDINSILKLNNNELILITENNKINVWNW